MAHPVVWFEVLGNDGKRLQSYYSELFGWTISVDNPLDYGMVDTGAKSGIPGGVGRVLPGTRSWVTFYVESANLEETLARAEQLGGKTVMPPTQLDGPKIAFLQDPEGHVVGLIEKRAEA